MSVLASEYTPSDLGRWPFRRRVAHPNIGCPVPSTSLRVCDFIVFSQNPMLKTDNLHAKKTCKFKKVTNYQDKSSPVLARAVPSRPSVALLTDNLFISTILVICRAD